MCVLRKRGGEGMNRDVGGGFNRCKSLKMVVFFLLLCLLLLFLHLYMFNML